MNKIIDFFNVINVLRDRSTKNFTENDIKILQEAVKFFEEWFYLGEWVTTSNYFLPASVINMLTKFKEQGELTDKIGGFDKKKLNDFIEMVSEFAFKLFSGKLKSSMPPSDFQNAEEVFKKSKKSVISAIGFYGNKAGDLYFLKTCIIAAEMIRQKQKDGSRLMFIPDATISIRNEYKLFDFSNGTDAKKNLMHYPTHRIAFCKYVVEYLRSSLNLF